MISFGVSIYVDSDGFELELERGIPGEEVRSAWWGSAAPSPTPTQW